MPFLSALHRDTISLQALAQPDVKPADSAAIGTDAPQRAKNWSMDRPQ
jgi:hypothetical protein